MTMIGYSAKIQVNDGSGGAFADFNEVTNITVPMQEQATVDATHLQSPNRYREYVAGLIEPGEMSFEQNYTETEYTRVVGLRGQKKQFKVIFPDGLTAGFDGILTKSEVSLTVEEVVKITNTVKVAGSVTLTPG